MTFSGDWVLRGLRTLVDPGFDPADIALIHLDPSKGVTEAGSEITRWANRGLGGSTYDFTDTGGPPGNVTDPNALNGRRAIDLRPSSGRLQCAAPLASQRFLHDGTGCDVIVVFIYQDNSAFQTLVCNRTGSTTVGFDSLIRESDGTSPSRIALAVTGGTSNVFSTLDTQTLISGQPYVARLSYSNAAPRGAVDSDGTGVTDNTAHTPSTGDASGLITLGSRPSGGFPVPDETYFGDVIINNARFTSPQLTSIYTWLVLKYGRVTVTGNWYLADLAAFLGLE